MAGQNVSARCHQMDLIANRRGARTRGGFTLVEIMIVVVIIGLLAALAIPAFQRTKQATINARVANDFRVFSQAFDSYAMENGFWPPNAGNGVVPAGMSGNFKADVWTGTTVIGGRWNWDRGFGGVAAGISIARFTVDDTVLQAIDARIDDGDLSTGQFQKTMADRVTYILEQ